MEQLNEIDGALRDVIAAQGSVLVALSGGVDSSVIAAVAVNALGQRAIAATGVSDSLSANELEEIENLCGKLGLRHETVTTHELRREEYTQNAPSRCYFCKDELYSRLDHLAKRLGLARVLDGTTACDLKGHRPGHRAANEHDVLSPFVKLEIDKTTVRALAQSYDLPNATRPASPCLSSRIAYGVRVTPKRLSRVSHAEKVLHDLGFGPLRVRLHDEIARIEVPPDAMHRLLENAETIRSELRRLGFTYVTLDLGGLRSGSMLEVLQSAS